MHIKSQANGEVSLQSFFDKYNFLWLKDVTKDKSFSLGGQVGKIRGFLSISQLCLKLQEIQRQF